MQIRNLVSILIVIVAVCLFHGYIAIPNHDASVILIEAKTFADGGRFYDDIMEVNPPLIVFLSVPTIWISKLFGLTLWSAYCGYVMALIVLSLLAARKYLYWAFIDRKRAANWLNVAYIVILTIVPIYDFGQREHLTMILLLPGLFWFSARDAGRLSPVDAHCLLSLAMAGVGLLLKPFFALVLAMGVLWRALSNREWRLLFGPETIVIGAMSLGYVAIVYCYTPGWIKSTTLSMQVYFAYTNPWLNVFLHFLYVAALLVLVVTLISCSQIRPVQRIILNRMLVCACIFLVLAFAQQKGWPYHALPALILAFLSLAYFAVDQSEGLNGSGFHHWDKVAIATTAFSSLYLFAITLYVTHSTFRTSTLLSSPFVMAVKTLADGRNWMVLSTGVKPAFPVALFVKGWCSRSAGQWIVPGAVQLSEGDEQQRARGAYLQQLAANLVAEDIEKCRPRMIAVMRKGNQGVRDPFDLIAFFKAESRFEQSWRPYRLVEVTDEWQFYIRLETE